MRVLVLGAYGFLGSEITRRLRASGAECRGVVRNLGKAARLLPGVNCVQSDISKLTDAADWSPLIDGCDVVVNASGALQTGLRDNLDALQDRAICALIEACEATVRPTFVQISAPGADPAADTEFMRSKSAADAVLRKSSLDWIIFKPGLVIGRSAYGGTAALRMLAGFPRLQPLFLSSTRIQTVAIEDVADAVVAAVEGRVATRADYDLVEDDAHSLGDIVVKFRGWMGFDGAARVVEAPKIVHVAIAALADIAGWLGWRSPLRSTSLRVLKSNVIGDPSAWRKATGRSLRSLDETLALRDAPLQERIFARAALFYPIAILTLAAFFVASGVIGLWRIESAAAILNGAVSNQAAKALVLGGSILDVALGLAILVRPWTVGAAIGMILLSLSYLIGGSFLTPELWSDPLGPLVKIVPVAVLAMAVALLSVER